MSLDVGGKRGTSEWSERPWRLSTKGDSPTKLVLNRPDRFPDPVRGWVRVIAV